MGKAKTALDTNIIISALGWEGNPKKVLELAVSDKIEMIISKAQFEELSEVLNYTRFNFTQVQKDRIKALILKIATFAEPSEKVNAVKNDPDDNRILECAIAGKASHLITGDKDLLRLKSFRKIKITTAQGFLQEMGF